MKAGKVTWLLILAAVSLLAVFLVVVLNDAVLAAEPNNVP